MQQHRNHIIWNMTKKCNFRCHYCYFPHDNSPVTETLPTQKILDFLSTKKGEWLVGMTGGEPFLYPKFVDICEKLTQQHVIGVDTNLSMSKKIQNFADRIPPERVHDIYASLHIEERERRKGVPAFIRNYHTLKERGFNIIVNYVVHPTLIAKYIQDQKFFAEQGVEIVPRPFKGRINGIRYPEGYGPEAKAIFANYPDAGKKMVFNFRGVPCHGGHTFLRLEPDGTVLRCPGDKTVMGNITEGVTTESGPTPCRVNRCPCQGIHYVILTEAQQQFVEGMRQMVIGEHEAARETFSRTLHLAPDMSNAANNLGVISLQQGNTNEANAYFTLAQKTHPHVPLYTKNLEQTPHQNQQDYSTEVATCGTANAKQETPVPYPSLPEKQEQYPRVELCDVVDVESAFKR